MVEILESSSINDWSILGWLPSIVLNRKKKEI